MALTRFARASCGMCSLNTYSTRSLTISASANPRSCLIAATFSTASLKFELSSTPAMASMSSGLGWPVVAYTEFASIGPSPSLDRNDD